MLKAPEPAARQDMRTNTTVQLGLKKAVRAAAISALVFAAPMLETTARAQITQNLDSSFMISASKPEIVHLSLKQLDKIFKKINPKRWRRKKSIEEFSIFLGVVSSLRYEVDHDNISESDYSIIYSGGKVTIKLDKTSLDQGLEGTHYPKGSVIEFDFKTGNLSYPKKKKEPEWPAEIIDV